MNNRKPKRPLVKIAHNTVLSKGKLKPGFLSTITSKLVSSTPIQRKTTTNEICVSPYINDVLEQVEWYETYVDEQRPRTDAEKKLVEDLNTSITYFRTLYDCKDRDRYALALHDIAVRYQSLQRLLIDDYVQTGMRQRKRNNEKQEDYDNACQLVEKLLMDEKCKSLQSACKEVAKNSRYGYKAIETECKRRGITSPKVRSS